MRVIRNDFVRVQEFLEFAETRQVLGNPVDAEILEKVVRRHVGVGISHRFRPRAESDELFFEKAFQRSIAGNASHLFKGRAGNRLLVGDNRKRFESRLGKSPRARVRKELSHPRIISGTRSKAIASGLFHDFKGSVDFVQVVVRKAKRLGNGLRIQKVADDFLQLSKRHDIGRRKD